MGRALGDAGDRDAVVVGAGPNGLAAAIELARNGKRVAVLEANDEIGGGCRSAELTLPGFVHDVCSAFHPLGAGSPFFAQLPLARYGLEWIHPAAPLAHPLDDGTAVVLERSIEDTARGLGRDAGAWRRTVGAVARDWEDLLPVITGPALTAVSGPAVTLPGRLIALARFGALAAQPARMLANISFRETAARALFAGCAAHSFLPLDAPFSATFGLMLAGSGHALGWPIPRGGSQRIADALASHLRSLGGSIEIGRRVRSMDDLPPARAYLFSFTPRQLENAVGDRFPDGYRRALRGYRYGPGVYKVDYALDGPIPWRAEACRRAGTVHVGGTLEDIAAGEAAVARGEHPERPFVLVGQQSLFDPMRAPEGKHTVWAYCHVPNGSTVDMSGRITAQIERFAPGFADRILATHLMDTRSIESHNETNVGGDISAGSHGGLQLFARPAVRLDLYSTPAPDIFICSAATPPGGGVHGMCGYHAARSALRRALA